MEMQGKSRHEHLCKQRNLQIKRSGITGIFHKGFSQAYPCLQLKITSDEEIQSWLKGPYLINVYDENKNYLLTINKQNVYLDDKKIFFKDRYAVKSIHNNQFCYLAKNNPTIQVQKNALNQTENIDFHINSFIKNPNVLQIPSNQWFKLQQWAYKGLNLSQQKALELAAKQRLSFVKGPPGCGKTFLIARLATIFSYYKSPVIIGAVTNTANMVILQAILKDAKDLKIQPNILLFISKEPFSQNILHPPQIRPLTFRYKLAKNFLKVNEFEGLSESNVEQLLDKYFKNETMSRQFMSIYYQAMAKTLQNVDILIITTISALKFDSKLRYTQDQYKPVVGILDEASQAPWADAHCFLGRGVRKMIFIGDDKQLPPTVISQNQVLKQTMFTSLLTKNVKYYAMLNQQYRMNPAISQFPNSYFYQNQISNGVTLKDRMSNIQYFNKFPVSFIHTQSPQIEIIEQKNGEKDGKRNYWNFGQIKLIIKILQLFPKEQYGNIGIISPYDLQIKMICQFIGEQAFSYGLKANICESYQGSQKQYIIMSWVRSNKDGKIGFCNEQNRFNVSITRGKRGLVQIGNINTLSTKTQPPNIWFSYSEYLKSKNLLLDQSILQQFPKCKEEIINYKHTAKDCLQQLLTTTNQQLKKLKQGTNQQIKAETCPQVELLQFDNEEEHLMKIYKQCKKIIKNILNNIRNKSKQLLKTQDNQKQLQKQIQQLKQQVRNTVKSYIYKKTLNKQQKTNGKQKQKNSNQHHQKTIKLTQKQLNQYTQISKQYTTAKQKCYADGKTSKQSKLTNLLEQLVEQIAKQKQFNHLKQNKIILRCIDISIFWALYLNFS